MVTSTFVLLKHKREMSSSFIHLLSVHNAPVCSSYMISFYPQHNGSRCHSRPYSLLPINFSTLDLAMGLDLRSWDIGSTLLYVLGALRPPSRAQAWASLQDGRQTLGPKAHRVAQHTFIQNFTSITVPFHR